MGVSRFFGAVIVGCVLAVAATATSVRAQSGHPGPAQAQGTDDLDALKQVVQLFQSGKYTEATEIAEGLLALAERKFSPDHPNVAILLNTLGELYRIQGRYAEAEPLYKRSLAIYEKTLDPDRPAVATTLNSQALLYQVQGRYAEAEPLYKRSLALPDT